MSETNKKYVLIKKAKNDLQALYGMLDSDVFTEEIFGFHAQQAVEKALKAWINHLGFEHPKIHDIRELLRILRNYGANVDLFLDLMELNIFAIQFRYEVFTEFETPLEREAIIEEVRPVLEHVDSLIGSELQD